MIAASVMSIVFGEQTAKGSVIASTGVVLTVTVTGFVSLQTPLSPLI